MVSAILITQQKIFTSLVLILIMLEGGFCYLKNDFFNTVFKKVLILIMLEGGFCFSSGPYGMVFPAVLILIMLEGGFCYKANK